jgi:hypothetical protein
MKEGSPVYTKWLLGTSSHGSSAPMNFYLCVPDEGTRHCLLVTCWADGDRFHSVQDAEAALGWDERHGLRVEITRAARGLLNTRPGGSRRGKDLHQPNKTPEDERGRNRIDDLLGNAGGNGPCPG